ncbi:MAG: Bacterial non-heme ferritin [Syntrophus sp. SKADARSKE-3]|nr:Bacterial non-heme ferritin [Syntrophus sp. SKADARSKE-3]
MIGKKMNEAMNEQIKHELESYYIYLSMVAYFHSLNLDGMAHWMRVQAHEEMIHAMKFFDHIIDRGGTVTLLDLKQLKTTWKTPLEAWSDAYAHEQFITSKIHNLVKLSRKENDFSSETILHWFTNEQIEEESNTEKVSKQMALIGDSKEGLFMLDRELGARVFPAGSPIDPVAYNAFA